MLLIIVACAALFFVFAAMLSVLGFAAYHYYSGKFEECSQNLYYLN